MASNKAWNKIFRDYGINNHDFDKGPFELTANQIKRSCQTFTDTTDKEPRILCKQDTRFDRPDVFVKKGLFILPKKNGIYYILKGEGYVDVPDITTPIEDYESKLHLVERFIRIREKVNRIHDLTGDEEIKSLAHEILEEL